MNRSTVLAFLLCALTLPVTANAAKVFKCPGPSGSSVYSQFPCAETPAAPSGPEATAASAPAISSPTGSRPLLTAADCSARSRDITEQFSTDSAEATGEIRRLRERMAATGGYSTNPQSNGLRAELSAAEERLDAAGRTQRRAQLDLRKDCDASATASASASVTTSGAVAR